MTADEQCDEFQARNDSLWAEAEANAGNRERLLEIQARAEILCREWQQFFAACKVKKLTHSWRN